MVIVIGEDDHLNVIVGFYSPHTLITHFPHLFLHRDLPRALLPPGGRAQGAGAGQLCKVSVKVWNDPDYHVQHLPGPPPHFFACLFTAATISQHLFVLHTCTSGSTAPGPSIPWGSSRRTGQRTRSQVWGMWDMDVWGSSIRMYWAGSANDVLGRVCQRYFSLSLRCMYAKCTPDVHRSGGAYSSVMPLGSWTSFGREWAEPVGRIFWAGTEV